MAFLRTLAASALLFLAMLGTAAAQSCPRFSYGAVLTAGQWQACFDAKQNALGYTPVNKAGDVMLGRLQMAASTTSAAGINLPQGSAPSSPVNGDLWTTSGGIFVRIAGTTIGPLASASGAAFAATDPITVSFPSSVVTYGFNYGYAGTFTTTQTFTPGANAAGIVVSGVVNANALTASQTVSGASTAAILGLTSTWNTSGVVVGLQYNVTNTASNAASILFQLNVGGVQQFAVSPVGGLVMSGSLSLSTLGTFVSLTPTGYFNWDTRGTLAASGDGIPIFTNNAQTGFTRLIFGTNDASGIAIKKNGTSFNFRAGNDTGDVGITAAQADFTGTVTIALNAANGGALGVSGYSLTGSSAAVMVDLAGTWNTSGTPTAIKFNITDTASNAASLLADLQVGGVSKFSVTKGGLVTSLTMALNGCTIGSAVLCTAGNILSTGAVFAYNTTAIPAGGTTGAGFRLSVSTDFGMFFGSGAPTLSAMQGSIYLNSTGATAVTRFYVNTNSSTGWVALPDVNVTTLSSLASIGTITTGVWTGSVIAGAYVATAANASGAPSATFGVVKCDGLTITCASGIITAVGGAATDVSVGTTTVSSGTNAYLLYNNAGVLGNRTIASVLTAGTAITITGTTNATINAVVASASEFLSGTASKLLDGAVIYQAETTSTFNATQVLDFNTFYNTKVTLTANITSFSCSNQKAGQSGTIRFIQDGTGSRTLPATFGCNMKFAGGTQPVLSTAAGSVDTLFYSCSATNYCVAALAKAIATLLERDLRPAANDNSPMWLNKAA